MEPAYRRCCGIDVHKDTLTVTVLPPVGRADVKIKKQVFRTFTRNLRRLRAWLSNCRVTEVAMESTGQYWRAVWNILEGSVPRMLLLNPLHVRALKGEKTDAIDSERIAMLLQNHELRGSFVPPREIRELRELLRHRVHLLEESTRVKNRIEQVCQSGNIKISSVATNIFGLSGRQMLEGLIEGKRDPGWLADYARTGLRRRKAELELALEGTLTAHQRGMLAAHLRHLDWLQAEIAEVARQVREHMQPYEAQTQRLNAIPGVDELTAWSIIAEMGPDGAAFPRDDNAASWAGLCPGNNITGGKRLSSRTRHGNPYLCRALCQAARAAIRTKGAYPGALYRHMRRRMVDQAAVVAVAHWMIVVAYHILRDGSEYYEIGADFFDRQNRPRAVRRLVQRLNLLGYQVELQEVHGGAAAPGAHPVSAGVRMSEVKDVKGLPAG